MTNIQLPGHWIVVFAALCVFAATSPSSIIDELSGTTPGHADAGIARRMGGDELQNLRNVGIGILSVQEGKYVEGQWQPGRWLNGDQTHQGRHLRLAPGKFDLQRIKLYRYR